MKWEPKRRPGTGYFAAANSADGFVSYYRECFLEGTDRVYMIKGGPGTGKSRFLGEIAGAAEKAGHGVERYFCSSDPDSLDGVRLTNGHFTVSLIDATAPHVVEPERPGARDEIVNLGAFWDRETLWESRRQTEDLAGKKGDAYRAAYGHLSACGTVARARIKTMRRCFLTEKAGVCARNILRECRCERHVGKRRTVLTSAIGMKGYVRLDTLRGLADRVCLIEDTVAPGSGALFMEILARHADETQTAYIAARDPLLPEMPEAVFLPGRVGGGTLFLRGREEDAAGKADKILHVSRFMDPANLRAARADLRADEKARQTLLGRAIDDLESAAESHFALEVIYSAAMDFGAKERFTADFAGQVLEELQKH